MLDCYHGSYNGAPIDGSAWLESPCLGGERVVRGGSWIAHPSLLRSASRGRQQETGRSSFVGFRVARPLRP